MKNIAEQILKYRTEKGLSQTELAELLEVSRQSVSKWETGAAVPELAKIVRLCEVFEVSLDTFILETEGTSKKEEAPPAVILVPQRSISEKKIAGLIFLGIGILFQFLLAFAARVVLSELILWAIPFFACAGICLMEKKNAFLLCIWVWGIWVWALHDLVFSISILFYMIPVILIWLTLRNTKGMARPLEKKKKAFCIAGLIATPILFLTLYLGRTFWLIMLLKAFGIDSRIAAPGFLISRLLPILESALIALFAYLLVIFKADKSAASE